MHYNSKELSIIITFSAIGAILSVPIGHLGNYLKTVPILPLGTGQILAGLHLVMITLTALRLRKPGVATITGLVKGLVEAVLFSFHGLPVIVMSGVQGFIIDIFFQIFWYDSKIGSALACGVSALSNVLFIQLFLGMPFPASVYSLMYILSFISGVLLGAYPSQLLHKMINKRV